jgi:hypothetical protein
MPGSCRRPRFLPHLTRAFNHPTNQHRSKIRDVHRCRRRRSRTTAIPWPVRRAARRGSLASHSCATRPVPARWSNTARRACLRGPVHRESPANVRRARPSTSASARAAARSARGCAALPMAHPTSARPGCYACRSISKASEAACERRAEALSDSRTTDSRTAARRSAGLAPALGLWRTRRTARLADASGVERR